MTIEQINLENQEIGIGIGENAHRHSSVVKMLNLGRTPEAISEFTGEDLGYIKSVQQELLSVSELQTYN